jgi:S1-C subfamily serine protease
MKEKLTWGLVVVVSMALGAAGVVGIDSLGNDEPAAGSTTVIERVSQPDNSGVSQTAESLADLVDHVRPSIVRIDASSAGAFGSGVGSGIVLDTDGHILTNNHVVGDFGTLSVTLLDGTTASATLVGRDVGNDLAVIKADIPAEELQPATLGDSDQVRVGERVIAIGNPFTIEGTVTEGIVSGLGRSLVGTGGRQMRELIQADAAINPGNSGGALFNARGEVIGITTAIENPSSDRVFIGIGYAVPINTATRFLPQMLAGETIEHPRFGIELAGDSSPPLITGVVPGSGAEQGNLQPGDEITALDGVDITTFDELAEYIDNQDVGDVVDVTIMRNGQEMTLPVTLVPWDLN